MIFSCRCDHGGSTLSSPFFRHCDREKIQTLRVSMRQFVSYVRGLPNVLKAMQRTDDQVFYANGWTPFLEHTQLMHDVSDRIYCVQDTVPRGDSPCDRDAKLKEFNCSLTKAHT